MIFLTLLAAASIDGAAIAQTSATLNALGPHAFGSPRNRAAAQFVGAKLQDAGLPQTTIDDFTFDGVTGTNVVASLPGRSDRLLIIATHHDTRKEARDVSDRSRSLSLLIEIGRLASRLRPARTWILASFDGGESKGEGLASYLAGLGKSRGLVDGVVVLEAATLNESGRDPSLIVPACANGSAFDRRAIAAHDLVDAALSGVPSSLDVSFDDPGISLLTQPFIRAFKTSCEPMAARALASEIGVIKVAETSYSRGFLADGSIGQSTVGTDPARRDLGAVRLGEVAFAVIQGIDSSALSRPLSDSWLVVSRTVLPGWFVFIIGLMTLVPGLFALRAAKLGLALRAAYSVIFAFVLFQEPEVALFAGLLPNLLPPSAPRMLLTVALAPIGLLGAAGLLGMVRGQVLGSWVQAWTWAGLLAGFSLLYVSPGTGRKSAARSRRARR